MDTRIHYAYITFTHTITLFQRIERVVTVTRLEFLLHVPQRFHLSPRYISLRWARDTLLHFLLLEGLRCRGDCPGRHTPGERSAVRRQNSIDCG